MHWYLIHTKPRQERYALQNLEQQGYDCFLPTLPVEKIRQGQLTSLKEPLFPRYLFIHLSLSSSAKSWIPIRSTRGVSRLVTFGREPAKIDDELIKQLRIQEASVQHKPEHLFKSGELVCLAEAPFTGINGIYQMTDGERRSMVLIETLSKQVVVRASPSSLSKAS